MVYENPENGREEVAKQVILVTQRDVEQGRTANSTIARHTEQFKHEIDWTNTECLETEKKVISTENYRKCVHQSQQVIFIGGNKRKE